MYYWGLLGRNDTTEVENYYERWNHFDYQGPWRISLSRLTIERVATKEKRRSDSDEWYTINSTASGLTYFC